MVCVVPPIGVLGVLLAGQTFHVRLCLLREFAHQISDAMQSTIKSFLQAANGGDRPAIV